MKESQKSSLLSSHNTTPPPPPPPLTHHAVLFGPIRPQRLESLGQVLIFHGPLGRLESPLELVQLGGADARVAGQLEA